MFLTYSEIKVHFHQKAFIVIAVVIVIVIDDDVLGSEPRVQFITSNHSAT